MEIIRAFQNNDLSIQITVQGTPEEPLFRASDIGLVLGFNDINNTVKTFTAKEKVRLSTPTPGGVQEVNFLTERGLYKLLFKSRKEIAIIFQDWVYEVLREIRLTGKFQLEQQLQFRDQQLQIKDKDVENTLIINFSGKLVVYFIVVEVVIKNGVTYTILKFGNSKDIIKRMKKHRTQFGKDIILKNVFETIYNREFEMMIKQDPVISTHIISKIYKTNQTELIQLDDTFSYEDLIMRLEHLKNAVKGDLVANLLTRINELEHSVKDRIIEDKEEEKVEIVRESNQEIGKLKCKNVVLLKQVKENPFRARNIITGEIISFKTYKEAEKISGIPPATLSKNYLDKPNQYKGYVYYSEDKPYWKPPPYFIFDTRLKPSTHMVMCKSINKENGEVTYYNSMKEAAKHVGLDNKESVLRKFTWLCKENISGRKTTNKKLNIYVWYKIYETGSWVYPDGSEKIIPEKIIVMKLVKGKSLKN